MNSQPARNLVASVHQRLLNLAQQQGENFQDVLRRYAQERLMYRVSRMDSTQQLILKGALLFCLWDEKPHRATRDLDFLGSGESDAARFEQFFRALCQLEVEPDGITLVEESVVARQMREDGQYQGVRVGLLAKLGSARIPLQVDIGFGDVVTPAPLEVEFPTLLNLPKPRLRAYPRETVVAEKFCIMTQLGIANTRLKDFYDIWTLAGRFPFDGQILCQAIQATFARRRTPLPAEPPTALTSDFSMDPVKQRQWLAFLGKGRLQTERKTLNEITPLLQDFLMPPTLALVATQPFAQVWPAGGPWQMGEETLSNS